MKSTTVTVEQMDVLFPKWNVHINASGLYRDAIRAVMQEHDVTPHELRELVDRASDAGYDLDGLVEGTDRFDDLETLVKESEESGT